MDAVIGRVRESRLDHAFQFASDDTRHGRDFKAGLAELQVDQGEANGADQQEDPNDREEQPEIGDRIFRRLLRNKHQHRHGNEVPDDGKYPTADHAGTGVAFDAALGPVLAPQPRFGWMLGLCALLALQELHAVDGSEHQPKPNSAEDQAKNQQQPRLGVTGARDHLGDRPGKSEQPEAGKGQGEQADEYRSEFGGAVHSRSLWRE